METQECIRLMTLTIAYTILKLEIILLFFIIIVMTHAELCSEIYKSQLNSDFYTFSDVQLDLFQYTAAVLH